MKLEFSKAPVIDGRYAHLKNAVHQSKLDGLHVEFGVHSGSTLNFLAACFPETSWWGFDSFEGLPEPWLRSKDGTRRSDRGEFALPKPPRVEPNAGLVVGYFDDTIVDWLKHHKGVAAFIHVDSDLYSSAISILKLMNDRIKEGTVIVFDELRDWSEQGVYERWREGEWRALHEWLSTYDREVRPLARTSWIEGSVMVTK